MLTRSIVHADAYWDTLKYIRLNETVPRNNSFEHPKHGQESINNFTLKSFVCLSLCIKYIYKLVQKSDNMIIDLRDMTKNVLNAT